MAMLHKGLVLGGVCEDLGHWPDELLQRLASLGGFVVFSVMLLRRLRNAGANPHL